MTKQPSEYRARRALGHMAYLPRHAKPYTWERAETEARAVLMAPTYLPKHAGRRA